MPQITGWPGAGARLSSKVLILTGSGDPNTSSTPDVQNAQIGSLYLRDDGPDANSILYICSVSAVRGTAGVLLQASQWTAK